MRRFAEGWISDNDSVYLAGHWPVKVLSRYNGDRSGRYARQVREKIAMVKL